MHTSKTTGANAPRKIHRNEACRNSFSNGKWMVERIDGTEQAEPRNAVSA
jgi:hypothetical protein